MPTKADFWDVVRVSGDCPDVEARGKLGYVAGIGEEAGNPERLIGIWFYDLQQVWCIDEPHLILLGHKDELAMADHRRSLREGPSLRVKSDGTLAD